MRRQVIRVLVLPAAVAKRRLPCFRVAACGQQAKHPERPKREAQLETHASGNEPGTESLSGAVDASASNGESRVACGKQAAGS